MLGGDSINFLRQAMQVGVHIPYTGRIELGGRNQPIIEAGGMEKSISAWQYSALANSPQNKAFAEKIKAKYKAEPYLRPGPATTASACWRRRSRTPTAPTAPRSRTRSRRCPSPT